MIVKVPDVVLAIKPTAPFEPRMSIPLVRFQEPERFDVTVAGFQSTEPDDVFKTDWNEIHRVVQKYLRKLHGSLAEKQPAYRAEYGKSRGRIFPLYSHVSFDDPECPDKFAIVAGIDFEHGPTPDTLSLRAEIIREEEGTLLFRRILENVPTRMPEVLASTGILARELSKQQEIVRSGLSQPDVASD